MDAMESIGCGRKADNETRKASMHARSNPRIVAGDTGTGVTGLKSTAMAISPAVQ